MRRTFQNLAREANIDSLAKRNICGHATEKMSELYSTMRQQESRRRWEGHLPGRVAWAGGGPGWVCIGYACPNGPSEGSDEAPEAETKIGLTH